MDARASHYHDVYARWQRDPLGFWAEAAADIEWFEKPSATFDPKAGIYGRWFPGGVCNTCFNAVDRHVDAGRGDQVAIIYNSPLAGTKRTITYHRLLTETQVLAIMLRDLGVQQGDRVILYMPMVPEAVIAMLACARIGAIHSVVFGGFAAHELATRIDDARPKVILSASCGIEPGRIVAYKPLLDEAIALSQHKPGACLILQRPQAEATMVAGRDHDWAKTRDHALIHARSVYDCVPVAATDPLYILYTSGTTGQPKGVVRDNGGHMVALKWSMKYLYGIEPGETWWAASDIGWVVGHSYIVYAPLLHGCTSILYEGKPVGTPDAGAYLAGDRRAWRRRAVHRAHRLPRHQEGRPARQADGAARSVEIPHPVPRRRARRSADARMGGRKTWGIIRNANQLVRNDDTACSTFLFPRIFIYLFKINPMWLCSTEREISQSPPMFFIFFSLHGYFRFMHTFS